MNNSLYTNYADLYNAIAFDRDFTAECNEFINIFKQATDRTLSAHDKVLELFAGPAYHSHIFSKKYPQNVYCIDNSPQMKAIAKQHAINDSQYILGNLPDALDALPKDLKFDLIICPRYSIGLIDYFNFQKLFTALQYRVNKNCVLIFECHQINNLLSNFTNTDIKSRQTSLDNKNITCVWPSGASEWDSDDWTINMPIEIQVEEDNETKLIKTFSKERIYVKNDFKRLLDGCPIFKICDNIKINTQLFNKSNLIIIKVESHD